MNEDDSFAELVELLLDSHADARRALELASRSFDRGEGTRDEPQKRLHGRLNFSGSTRFFRIIRVFAEVFEGYRRCSICRVTRIFKY